MRSSTGTAILFAMLLLTSSSARAEQAGGLLGVTQHSSAAREAGGRPSSPRTTTAVEPERRRTTGRFFLKVGRFRTGVIAEIKIFALKLGLDLNVDEVASSLAEKLYSLEYGGAAADVARFNAAMSRIR